MADRWVVVGLGNPGSQYSATRHNVGQMVTSYLASGRKFSSHKSRMNIADISIGDVPVTIATSQGYMNETGVPLRALIDFYKVPSDRVIAVCDEMDIPFNTMRLKFAGGDNGHNGLKSLTSHISSDYFRLRMGVGRPPVPQDPASFVLRPFSTAESKDLSDFIARGAQAIERLIEKGLAAAQQEFNS